MELRSRPRAGRAARNCAGLRRWRCELGGSETMSHGRRRLGRTEIREGGVRARVLPLVGGGVVAAWGRGDRPNKESKQQPPRSQTGVWERGVRALVGGT